MSTTTADCWVLSDGKAGNEVQSLGLAAALGREPRLCRFTVRPPWGWLPPQAWFAPFAAVRLAEGSLQPPWPGLVIGTGRLTAPLVAAIRRASGGQSFAIQIQDSTLSPDRFDLVVVPEHDRLRGANVLLTKGSLNRLTPALLEREAARLMPQVSALPRPLVAVLIGGNSRSYRLTRHVAERLVQQLRLLAVQDGAGLLVTLSRRSSPEAAEILRQGLTGETVWFWDGEGDNPYFGFLGLADHLVVTRDSVNMISEAASSGKPVHLVELEGGSAKFERFHEAFRQAGITRPFDGKLETWSYQPLAETARIAAQIRPLLAARESG